MITIQSGKLTIPEDERFVGFAGDNLTNKKHFVLTNHGEDDCTYSLCLRFDDDAVRVVPLTKSVNGSDLILTWTVRSAHMVKSGVVMAQVKSVDSDDAVVHTGCDYFIVSDSAEFADDGGDENYVSREEVEERIASFYQGLSDKLPYIGEDGYWYCYRSSTDSFQRSIRATADITVDNAMITGSQNPVQNGAIKAYIDSGMSIKVNANTTIADLPLRENISRQALAANLSESINPPAVVSGVTVGYSGQYGKTSGGRPMMCTEGSSWTELVRANDVYSKNEIDSLIGDIESALRSI